jgi:hypothetical protein
MLSQPIPFYLKQAFELLCFTHPYIDLFNHVYYLLLFSAMLLSEGIYLSKLSMIVRVCFVEHMFFAILALLQKAPFKNKYSLFIVL